MRLLVLLVLLLLAVVLLAADYEYSYWIFSSCFLLFVRYSITHSLVYV